MDSGGRRVGPRKVQSMDHKFAIYKKRIVQLLSSWLLILVSYLTQHFVSCIQMHQNYDFFSVRDSLPNRTNDFNGFCVGLNWGNFDHFGGQNNIPRPLLHTKYPSNKPHLVTKGVFFGPQTALLNAHYIVKLLQIFGLIEKLQIV